MLLKINGHDDDGVLPWTGDACSTHNITILSSNTTHRAVVGAQFTARLLPMPGTCVRIKSPTTFIELFVEKTTHLTKMYLK